MTEKKKVSVKITSPDQKKSCTRFSEVGGKDVLNGTIYVGAKTMEALGNPTEATVTIEAA
jgi:hypothetical protein